MKVILSIILLLDPIMGFTGMTVAIAGGTASGKTTLSQKICNHFKDDVAFISQDQYYKDLSSLPYEKRELCNYDHPDSFDNHLLSEHLKALKSGLAVETPLYDFCTHTRKKETKKIEPKDVIIVEGILLLAEETLREHFDLMIFVDTDDDTRLLRRIERDLTERGRDFQGIKKQYFATVKPMHEAFVFPSKRHADLIIRGDSKGDAAFSALISILGNPRQK